MLDCQCRHKFSHSNAWTALTDVPPKELPWPLCTDWTLGWCRMLLMPLLIQSYECCPVVLDWCLMPCCTQYIHNLAWNGQWPSTASGVCSVPTPLQVCNHSDEIEGLLVLGLQHPDVLLEGETRVPPTP